MLLSIPKIIHEERIKQGLSMRSLGKKAGLNGATISNLEKKARSVSPKTAKAICDALDLSFDLLFSIS